MRGHGDLEAAVGGAALCALLALFPPSTAAGAGRGAAALLPARLRDRGGGLRPRSHPAPPLPPLQRRPQPRRARARRTRPQLPAGWDPRRLLGAAALPRRSRRQPRGGVAATAAGRRPGFLDPPASTPPRPSLLAAGALLVVAAVVLAFAPLSATNAIGYTEIWIQPRAASEGPGVRVGVGSGERDDSSYRLVVEFGDGEGEATRQLTLAPGGEAGAGTGAT